MFSGLILTPQAEDDLLGIVDYTAGQWGYAQADRYLDALEEACRQIIAYPFLGKSMAELAPLLRAHPCEQHVIFYLTLPEEPVFIAFLHERMAMLERLGARLES